MDVLEKLFGSAAKVKIIKLFLMNPEASYDSAEVALKAKISQPVARREIADLEKIGFVKARSYNKEIRKQQNRDIKIFHKRSPGWILDPKFPYVGAMESFLSSVNPFRHRDIVEKISRAGKIQLLVISGVFTKYDEARADLLIVGDNLKLAALEKIVQTIESEIGKEIRYAVFETGEFNYRYSLFDKLIRDILDFPHEKIINKLNIR